MESRTQLTTNSNTQKHRGKPFPIARATTLGQQEMDDRLHEALVMSFDCGDPVALQIT